METDHLILIAVIALALALCARRGWLAKWALIGLALVVGVAGAAQDWLARTHHR
jgi:hypothetical protein